VRRLSQGLPVMTESYGTLELENAPVLPEATEIARSCGIDLTTHRSRCLRDVSLVGTDLVLGFEEDHVREAVVDAEAPRNRSFTARHFARLLTALPPSTELDVATRARAVVEQAEVLRSELPANPSDNMLDPLGAAWKAQRATAIEIREMSIALVAALFNVNEGGLLPPVPPNLRRRLPLRQRLRLG
jgi:protein-tyrosine-phosphatase